MVPEESHRSDITYSDIRVPIIDIAIMSISDQTVITVGAFGWWVAWLPKGKAVYLMIIQSQVPN